MTASSALAEMGADDTRTCGPPLAITFDFWNTIAIADMAATRAARRKAMLEVLERNGRDRTEDEIERAFDDTVRVFNEAWRANRQFTAEDGGEHAAELLVPGTAAAERAELVEAFVVSARSVQVELSPNVAEVLVELHGLGIKLGVICDVGLTPSSTLREYLDRHGVLGCFDHLSFSDEVGVYKPAPAIFAHALEGLGGVVPGRAAHVGDLRRTDVAGARDQGMVSVRYRGSHDDQGDAGEVGEPVEAHHVIDDHSELMGVLELG